MLKVLAARLSFSAVLSGAAEHALPDTDLAFSENSITTFSSPSYAASGIGISHAHWRLQISISICCFTGENKQRSRVTSSHRRYVFVEYSLIRTAACCSTKFDVVKKSWSSSEAKNFHQHYTFTWNNIPGKSFFFFATIGNTTAKCEKCMLVGWSRKNPHVSEEKMCSWRNFYYNQNDGKPNGMESKTSMKIVCKSQRFVIYRNLDNPEKK